MTGKQETNIIKIIKQEVNNIISDYEVTETPGINEIELDVYLSLMMGNNKEQMKKYIRFNSRKQIQNAIRAEVERQLRQM